LGTSTPRFLVDSMLGRLVRWLRILGYDSVYLADAEDEELMDMAEEEDRILLTADVALYEKSLSRGIEAYLVENKNHLERLLCLAEEFDLSVELDPGVSRCPICNSELEEVSSLEVEDRIPPASLARSDRFWRCVNCGKLYWQGSHWDDIENRLSWIRRSLSEKS